MERQIKIDIIDKKTKQVLNTITDEKDVYKKLCDCMSLKYLFKSKWVKRLTHYSNYDGTRNVKVYFNNDTIWDFTVKE